MGYLKPKIGELRKAREEANITKHKLSKLAGLPGNAVFRAESGRQSIHRLRAKAIAEALGKKLEDLFETEECNEDLTMAV